MQSIKGYKWDTIEEADLVMNQLNDHYGLPVETGGSYFSSDSYSKIEDFYFLNEHEMLIPVLGEPYQFDVNINI